MSHLACAWLYITVTGALLLLVSLLLALVCVRGCDHRRKAKARAQDQVSVRGRRETVFFGACVVIVLGIYCRLQVQGAKFKFLF
jgi:putative copper export protein